MKLDYLGDSVEIWVVFGLDLEYFIENGIEIFLSFVYVIMLESDRMGYWLEGLVIEYFEKGFDIVISFLVFGSI